MTRVVCWKCLIPPVKVILNFSQLILDRGIHCSPRSMDPVYSAFKTALIRTGMAKDFSLYILFAVDLALNEYAVSKSKYIESKMLPFQTYQTHKSHPHRTHLINTYRIFPLCW